MEKKCGKCQIIKDISNFSKNASKSDGYTGRCKECTKAHRPAKSKETLLAERRWRYNNTHKTKEANKKHEAKRKYGITLEEYYRCMNTSDKCEICGSVENLCYDHCHTSMKFRGVLCRKCNSGIGQLGDTSENVEKALKYLLSRE